MCFVAARYGVHFEAVVRALGRDPASTAVLVPDIGGVLLASDVQIVDLAGLADVELARLIADGTPAAVADQILEELRPVVVHVHGDWVSRSGLLADPRFRAEYVDVLGEEDWVRRDAFEATSDPVETLARIRAAGVELDPRPMRASCARELFADS
jgi:hypothetical protein